MAVSPGGARSARSQADAVSHRDSSDARRTEFLIGHYADPDRILASATWAIDP